MVIKEISLCEAGMNDDARVVIVKAKGDEPFKHCADCSGGTAPFCKKNGKCAGKPGDLKKENAAALEEARAVVLEMLPDLADNIAAMLVAKAQAGGVPVSKQSAAASAASIMEVLMDVESLAKALEKAETDITALVTTQEELSGKLETAQETIGKQNAELETLRKSQNPPTDDEVMKALPAPVRERIEKAQADAKAATEAMQKMADERELEAAISKAKTIGVANPDTVGALLVRVGKGKTTADDLKAIEAMLKSAVEVEKASALFKSMGHHAATDGDPEVLMKSKAEEIRKAKPELTEAAAFDLALQQNPDLYAAYQAKRRATA